MDTIQNALANEALLKSAQIAAAQHMAKCDLAASFIQMMNATLTDEQRALVGAQSAVSTIQAGYGSGITASFGYKSTVTQLAEGEREAALSAIIDFIKLNPTCVESDAAVAWNAAALASHPEFSMVLQDPHVFEALYIANLIQDGKITAPTFQALRDWVVATDKAVIMSM